MTTNLVKLIKPAACSKVYNKDTGITDEIFLGVVVAVELKNKVLLLRFPFGAILDLNDDDDMVYLRLQHREGFIILSICPT
jgi:hypothetical protein